jgi:hypothetical protein
MQEEVCPECGGDGYLIHVGGPGYYSASFGNYLPSETCRCCSFCGGTGTVGVGNEEVLEIPAA